MSFSIHSLSNAERTEVHERARDAVARFVGAGVLTMVEAVAIARTEMVAEHRDTIAVCESYLENAKECEGFFTGAVFSPGSIEFAHGQVAFEKAAIARLEGGA